MNIVIYGLGSGREVVEQCIRPVHTIVGYTDSFADIEYFGYKKFIKLEKLKEAQFDWLILTIKNMETCGKIIENLVSAWEIPREKILSFFEVMNVTMPSQKVDRILSYSDVCGGGHKYSGIILGISHAVCGINKTYLEGNYCNLALRSQDIYYNNFTLRYCIEQYAGQFDQLQNVIIEMYDYNYFNYDVSLLKNALDFYYCRGGITVDEHHFGDNKFFHGSLRKEMEQLGWKQPDLVTMQMRKQLFDDIKYVEQLDLNCDTPKQYTNSIKPNESLPSRKFVSSILTKRFEATIKENVEILEETIQFARTINPSMKIALVLIPRYITMETALVNTLLPWKGEFEEIVYGFQKKYGLQYYNFKNYTKISGNHRFYNDVNHLNKVGAMAFTAVLNQSMQTEA